MENLAGTFVLVHPKSDDSQNRQGQLGVIAAADLAKDEVYVGFGSLPIGRYTTDALLVLKPKGIVDKYLATHVLKMPVEDYKALLQISMFQNLGKEHHLKEALQMASTSENTLNQSTLSLREKLGLHKVLNNDLEIGKTLNHKI